MTTNNNALNWSRDDFSSIEEAFQGDLWERKQLADRLVSYIQRLKIGATLALDGEWGAGKTWFVNHLKKQLMDQGHQVVYLDAFINDYVEDPFLTLATEIANRIEDQETGMGVELRKTAVNAYHALLPNLPMLLFHLVMALSGAGMFAKGVSDTIKDVKEATGDLGEKAAEFIGEQVKEHLEEKVDNYEKDKQSLEYFKDELKRVTAELEHPLVFIIDELDRCKPEFSIRLIERIKHFFDTPNIVFLLVMHKAQLTESINSYYGFSSNNQYLEKFIDFTIKLNSESNKINYNEIIIKYLLELGILDNKNIENKIIFKEALWLFRLFKPNPRQIKKIFNKFSLLLEDKNKEKINILFLFLFAIELNLLDINKREGEIFALLVDKIQPVFINYLKLTEKFKDWNTSNPQHKKSFMINYIYEYISFNYAEYIRIYFSVKNLITEENLMSEFVKEKKLLPPENETIIHFEKAWFDYIHQGG